MKFQPQTRSSSGTTCGQQPVPFEVYTREYYLSDNSGFDLWCKTGGTVLEPRHQYALNQARLTAGDTVLDYGCGRGEIVLQAALCGAKAVGVDYAQAAIELTRETIRRAGLREDDRLQVILLAGKQLPFPDATFSRIFFLDVIEHLTSAEASAVLSEFYRVMASGGRPILHTSPNRIYYDYVYPRFIYPLSTFVDRILTKIRGRAFYNFPMDPRTPSEKLLHINEQNLRSLKRALNNAGFEDQAWASDRLLSRIVKNPVYVASRLLIKPSFWPLSSLFATDLWAVARKAGVRS